MWTSAETTLTNATGGGQYSIDEPTLVTEALGRDPDTVAREHAEKLTVWLTRHRGLIRAGAPELISRPCHGTFMTATG